MLPPSIPTQVYNGTWSHMYWGCIVHCNMHGLVGGQLLLVHIVYIVTCTRYIFLVSEWTKMGLCYDGPMGGQLMCCNDGPVGVQLKCCNDGPMS